MRTIEQALRDETRRALSPDAAFGRSWLSRRRRDVSLGHSWSWASPASTCWYCRRRVKPSSSPSTSNQLTFATSPNPDFPASRAPTHSVAHTKLSTQSLGDRRAKGFAAERAEVTSKREREEGIVWPTYKSVSERLGRAANKPARWVGRNLYRAVGVRRQPSGRTIVRAALLCDGRGRADCSSWTNGARPRAGVCRASRSDGRRGLLKLADEEGVLQLGKGGGGRGRARTASCGSRRACNLAGCLRSLENELFDPSERAGRSEQPSQVLLATNPLVLPASLTLPVSCVARLKVTQ